MNALSPLNWTYTEVKKELTAAKEISMAAAVKVTSVAFSVLKGGLKLTCPLVLIGMNIRFLIEVAPFVYEKADFVVQFFANHLPSFLEFNAFRLFLIEHLPSFLASNIVKQIAPFFIIGILMSALGLRIHDLHVFFESILEFVTPPKKDSEIQPEPEIDIKVGAPTQIPKLLPKAALI